MIERHRAVRVAPLLLNYSETALNSGPENFMGKHFQQLLAELPDGPSIFALEIGACDGLLADELHDFVRANRWRGLFVEPVPWLFAELKRAYADMPGLAFENVAITSQGGQAEMLTVPDARLEDLPRWVKGCSTLHSDRNPLGTRRVRRSVYGKIKERLERVVVTCAVLPDLLERHAVTQVDVLQIDTEGHDAVVLQQFDLEQFRPRAIKIEVIHLPDCELREIERRLSKADYRHCRDGRQKCDLVAWPQ